MVSEIWVSDASLILNPKMIIKRLLSWIISYILPCPVISCVYMSCCEPYVDCSGFLRPSSLVLFSCSYNRWLCRARAEDLSDIAALKALYQTGLLQLSILFVHHISVYECMITFQKCGINEHIHILFINLSLSLTLSVSLTHSLSFFSFSLCVSAHVCAGSSHCMCLLTGQEALVPAHWAHQRGIL